MNKQVLIVSPLIPYPPNIGGRLDIWNRILFLKSQNYNIDILICTKFSPSSHEVEYLKKYADTLIIIPRNTNILNAISYRSFQEMSRSALRNVPLYKKYDVVLLESEHVSQILYNNSLRYKKLFLRVHNNEFLYFMELARSTRNPIKWLYFILDAFRIYFSSKKIYDKADKLLFISDKEYQDYVNNNPSLKDKALWLPPAISIESFKNIRMGSNVLFVGSLFLVDNQAALKWYINKVHPHIKHPQYHLIIAGNSRNKSLSWLYSICRNYHNISIYDTPNDLEPIYASSSIFINPAQHGTGVKMKSVEAIQNGLALVSTTIGVQGSGLIAGIDFLEANEPRAFINAVNNLLDNEELRINIAMQSQSRLREIYDCRQLISNIMTSIAE